MARWLPSLLTALLLASLPGFGQIILGGPGIGFPGGGWPGRRNPQGRSQQGGENNDNLLVGILRNIGDKDIVIEQEDKTVTTVAISGSTKYLTTSGSKTTIGDFQPGDHISISTSQDKDHNYKAKSISMVSEGTADEHSLASLHTNDTNPLPGPDGAASSSGDSGRDSNKPVLRRANADDSVSSSDSGKPTLRRAPSSSGDSTASAGNSSSSSDDDDPDRPRLRRSSSNSSDSGSVSASNSPSDSDSGPPRLRRAVSSGDDSGPRAEISPGDSATVAAPRSSSSASSSSNGSSSGNDSYDPDVPRLRRSSPPADSSDNTVAEARPSLHADDVNGATRLPPPVQAAKGSNIDTSGDPRYSRMPGSGDEVIDKAREAAFSFTETLPNYVVKQFTTRYQTVPNRSGRTSWQALDVVTADVIEENGSERYKNILVNGKAPREDVEKTGSWSKGEFSSLQLDVLSPLTNADFHNKRSTSIVNRAAYRYDFSVEQPNSHWHVESEGQSYMPAYTGTIWIDKDTSRVLRIELQAQNMPRSFPLDQIESAVDYDFVVIGEGKFLLPTHSEALSCARSASNCTRNVIEFRNYKKFTADTSITFDPDDKQ